MLPGRRVTMSTISRRMERVGAIVLAELRAAAELEVRVLALVKAVENMAQADCLWRRDYLEGGMCSDNLVIPGCLSCRARAALADWKEGSAPDD